MFLNLHKSVLCHLINGKRCCLIAVFSFLLSSQSAFSQTGRALSFDGSNDYVSILTGLSGSYTKEVWINAASFTGFPNILSGTGTAVFLNAGRIAAGHSTGGFGQVLDPATLVAGTWYHIAVTYNAGTGAMLLYKNGVLVNSAAAVATYTEPLLEIGRFAAANNFNGSIDEVRLWNTVRTGAEISSSMNCELTGDEPGLRAYYHFNQGTAGGANAGITTLEDTKDACQVFDGTLNNFALTGATSNWVASGPALSGTCSAAFPNITVTGNTNCITSGDITPSTTDNTNFGDFGTLPISRQFIIQNTGNTVLNISGVTITGANAADFSVNASPVASLAASASTILSVTFNPAGANGVKNAMITISNDDPDEAVFTFNIQGTLVGGAQALAFDGVDDRVDLPFVFSGSYTKEAWITTNILTGFPNIISGNATTGTAIYLNSGRLAAGHGPSFTQLTDPVPLVVGTWYHVAVTYNAGTGVMNLYKNGAVVATGAVPAYTETQQQIGSWNGGNYFNGRIDEVRIWNTARSAAAISSTMSCPLSGTEAGLIAYYNFNQGANAGNNAGLTVLNDLVGNCPQNGTLVNFALTGTTSNWVSPGGTLTTTCNAQVPNIYVTGNNICIATGDPTPAIVDNTDFGLVNIPNSLDHTFVITNNGGAPLSISSVAISGTHASMFTVVTAPVSPVLPGGSSSFVLRFTPTGANGIKNATVTINNNDGNEAAYNFAVRGSSFDPTPVTFVYFMVSDVGRYSRLIWETATEINNKGFDIQRSINGSNNWETIGFVQGTNAANGSRYSFNDLAPFRGVNPYRLKQIDFDNRSEFSNIEVVNFASDAALVSVYPNPVQDKFDLVFNDPLLLNSNARISTASGAVVATIKLTNYRQRVDMSAYAKGIYFMSLQDGKVLRIIKQ